MLRKSAKMQIGRGILLRLCRPSLGIAAVAVVLTGSFSACTRDDRNVPPEKVTMAIAAVPEATLAQIAHSLGYFRDEGLDVAPRLHPYGKLALQDVLEGKADFATVAETPVMFAIMNGAKISVVATIMSSSLSNAVVARKDRGIGSVGDLRGKKVGATPGTTSQFFLDVLLTLHGISRSEVEVVDIPAGTISRALARGDIDAASTFGSFSVLTQRELRADAVVFRDKDIYRSTFNVIGAQESIGRKPDVVRKLIRALIRAEDFVKAHPEKAYTIAAQASGVAADVLRDASAGYNLSVTLDETLILALEDQSEWAIRNRLTPMRKIPNYLEFVHPDALQSVRPKAVRILK